MSDSKEAEFARMLERSRLDCREGRCLEGDEAIEFLDQMIERMERHFERARMVDNKALRSE